MKMPAPVPAIQPVMLQAEPEPLQIDLQRLAILVIDMQNAFVGEGGMMNLVGADVSGTPKIVDVINRVTRAARAKGVSVIFVVHNHSPDLRETGGPNSGYWYNAILRMYRNRPDLRDKAITRGTWGAEIVKGLEVKEDDLMLVKPRFSAFYGTGLDTILKTFNIKYLAFAGVGTNMCVEAAMRDASNLDYFSVLISDATAPGGQPSLKDATIHNVTMALGWVTTGENLVKALT